MAKIAVIMIDDFFDVDYRAAGLPEPTVDEHGYPGDEWLGLLDDWLIKGLESIPGMIVEACTPQSFMGFKETE